MKVLIYWILAKIVSNHFAVRVQCWQLADLNSNLKSPISGLVFKLGMDLFVYHSGWHCQLKCWRQSQNRWSQYRNSSGAIRFFAFDTRRLYDGGCGRGGLRTAVSGGARVGLTGGLDISTVIIGPFLKFGVCCFRVLKWGIKYTKDEAWFDKFVSF